MALVAALVVIGGAVWALVYWREHHFHRSLPSQGLHLREAAREGEALGAASPLIQNSSLVSRVAPPSPRPLYSLPRVKATHPKLGLVERSESAPVIRQLRLPSSRET